MLTMTLSVALYLLAAVISTALAVYALSRRQYPASLEFSALMGALAFWSACHTLAITSNTLATVSFWTYMQYLGVVLVSPLWLIFMLAFSGFGRFIKPMVPLLLLIAGLTFLAAATNPQHQLWWTSVELDSSRQYGSLSVVRGPLFYIHTVYSYTCIIAGLSLCIYTIIEATPLLRAQARLVLASALFPIVGNLFHILGWRTALVDDPTPFLFAASGLLIAIALRSYRFLDLTPVAHRVIFEQIPAGTVVLDDRGIVLSLNPAAQALLPAQSGPIVGQKLAELLNGSQLATSINEGLQRLPIPTVRQVRVAGEHGISGYDLRISALQNGHGHASGAVVLLQDISDQLKIQWAHDRRLEELTHISAIARAANATPHIDELLRTLTRVIGESLAFDRVAIGLLDEEGTQLRLQIDQPLRPAGAANAGLTSLEGRTVEAARFAPLPLLLRDPQPQVLHVDEPLLIDTPMQQLLLDLGLQTIVCVPLYNQGRALGLLGLGSTTARHIAADDLRLYAIIGELVTEAADRERLHSTAEQASQLRMSFLASATHELRTPLTSIIGYSEMLQRGLFGPLPAQIVDPINYMRHASQNLLRLINNLLDLSKMEAGRYELDLYPVDAVGIIESAVGAVQPQIQERGLELRLEIEPELPLVQGSSEHLEQVLLNLLANAVKFTDTGWIAVRAMRHADRVRISVQDTGIGIAAQDQLMLFRPFAQVKSQANRRYSGTGLGLLISRRFLELMGGAISVESQPGLGSTFHCDLPVYAEELLEQIAGTRQQHG